MFNSQSSEGSGLNIAEQEAALKRTATPALSAIEDDERRAPKWLRPLFATARDLLFHPDLDLQRIQDAAGFTDAEVWNAVREEVGQPAWNYFRDARLETSAHLLIETEMSVAEIGHLVGYTSIPTFRRLLRSFLGMPPSRYRRRARQQRARAGPLPAGAETHRYWERMLESDLSDDEARALDAYFERLSPASNPAEGKPEDRWTRLRRSLAEGLLETIDPVETSRHITLEDGRKMALPTMDLDSYKLSFDDQRRLVRDAVWFPDGTLFEALSERSARTDPRRGVELAILGVDYLLTSRIPEVDPRLLPLAWARLARARWRDGDLQEARHDLERAAQEADHQGEMPTAWEAERTRIAAALDWYQGRRRQALELADLSVDQHRVAGSPKLTAALVLRAELRAASADLEPESAGSRAAEKRRALTDLQEARDLPTGLPTTAEAPNVVPWHERDRWRAGISLEMRLLASVGTRAEIAAALPAMRRVAGRLGDDLAPHLRWLEGHAGVDAQSAWHDARERFAELGDDLWTARATFDLIRLHLEKNRPGEAAALAGELASTLAAVADDSTDLQPLTRAAPFTAIRSDDLDRAENVLKRLEWRRRAERALALAW